MPSILPEAPPPKIFHPADQPPFGCRVPASHTLRSAIVCRHFVLRK
jgi:hypothetical protein